MEVPYLYIILMNVLALLEEEYRVRAAGAGEAATNEGDGRNAAVPWLLLPLCCLCAIGPALSCCLDSTENNACVKDVDLLVFNHGSRLVKKIALG